MLLSPSLIALLLHQNPPDGGVDLCVSRGIREEYRDALRDVVKVFVQAAASETENGHLSLHLVELVEVFIVLEVRKKKHSVQRRIPESYPFWRRDVVVLRYRQILLVADRRGHPEIGMILKNYLKMKILR